MILSEIGEIAQACWLDIPNHFPFVRLGAFVVMPNHVHGIIVINKRDRIEPEHRVEPEHRIEPEHDVERPQPFITKTMGTMNALSKTNHIL